MANELVIGTHTLAFTKTGYPSISITVPALSLTVTGGGVLDNAQSVGTSEEAILVGDMTAGGWNYYENKDTTNYVEIRQGTGTTDLIQMLAGEWCSWRRSPDSSAPYIIANTAGCIVRCTIVDL